MPHSRRDQTAHTDRDAIVDGLKADDRIIYGMETAVDDRVFAERQCDSAHDKVIHTHFHTDVFELLARGVQGVCTHILADIKMRDKVLVLVGVG